jgi:hypothetical protein
MRNRKDIYENEEKGEDKIKGINCSIGSANHKDAECEGITFVD